MSKPEFAKELTNIRPRELPLVSYVDNRPSSSYGEYKPLVLHINNRVGDALVYQSYSSGKEMREFDLTRCNRVLDYDRTFTNGVIPSNGDFKLCSRCGTLEQFQETLNEYHRQCIEINVKHKAKQKEDELRSGELAEQRHAALKKFIGESGVAFEINEYGTEASILVDGFKFVLEVKEAKE